MQPRPRSRRRPSLALLPLPLLLLLTLCTWTALPAHAQWFSDPCQYNPRALQLLRQRFQSIVGQQYATEAIYAHVQQHLEQYERSRVRWEADDDQLVAPNKPLVLSFHGPTGATTRQRDDDRSIPHRDSLLTRRRRPVLASHRNLA